MNWKRRELVYVSICWQNAAALIIRASLQHWRQQEQAERQLSVVLLACLLVNSDDLHLLHAANAAILQNANTTQE